MFSNDAQKCWLSVEWNLQSLVVMCLSWFATPCCFLLVASFDSCSPWLWHPHVVYFLTSKASSFNTWLLSANGCLSSMSLSFMAPSLLNLGASPPTLSWFFWKPHRLLKATRWMAAHQACPRFTAIWRTWPWHEVPAGTQIPHVSHKSLDELCLLWFQQDQD